MNDIKLGNILVGKNNKPFIIAEMSGNHNQSLEKAFLMIDKAVEMGVDAVKIQTYTADTITINHNKGLFKISDKNSLWDGNTLYDLYEKAHTPWKWHKDLFDYSKKKGILIFSSPFDETAVDFLEELGNPIYKVASFENNHLPLLKKIALTGKPVIVSTGMASLAEIEMAVNTLKSNGSKDIILLKCTSSYPASPDNSNINTIPELERIFNCVVGISDHTLGLGVSIASVALGARVIEKHFVLDRKEGGVDSAFSLEPSEFKMLVDECNIAYQSLGKIKFGHTKSEESSIRFKRSIYVVEDIKAGELFTDKNIRIIRPGDGLNPMLIDVILGKKSKLDLTRGTPLSWDLLL